MTDSEHGPDSSTPPEPSGKGGKGKRQPSATASDTKATRKPRKQGKRGKPRRRTPRGTAADVERLTTIVFERLLLGERRGAILRFIANAVASKDDAEGLKWPTKEGPSPRTVDDYIARATAEIKTLSTTERAEAMAAARGRFLLIMKKAHDKGDLSTARLANRDLARIDGLEPVRVQHSGSVITEHTGTVTHEVHQRPATVEEQATTIRDLFSIAGQRASAAQAAAKSN